MKIQSVLGVGLALLWCGAALAQTPFSPTERDFSVAFVAAPTVQAPSSVEDTVGSFRRYATEEGGEAFVLTVDAYPAGFSAPAPTRAIYQRLAWAHANEPGVSMIGEGPALVSGLPGWEGTYRTADGRTEFRHILMVANRIYQLSDIGAATSANAEAFFDSFKVSPWAMAQWREPVRSAG